MQDILQAITALAGVIAAGQQAAAAPPQPLPPPALPPALPPPPPQPPLPLPQLPAPAAEQPGDGAAALPLPAPSHLNAFPPARGNLDAALAFLRGSQVSHIPHSAVLQQNILSDGRLYLGDANYRSQSPPRQRGVFDNIAACLLPVSPSRAKKAPSTTDEFSDQLRSWIRGNTTLKADTDRHNAWSEYVGEAIKYAHDVGVDAALKYHMQTMRAAQTTPLPRYDPQLHGRRYAEAYFDCIQPVQLAKLAAKAATPRRTQRGASSPSRDSRKRPNPAAASTNTPTTGQIAQAGTLLCSVHGVGGHDSAHCRSLKRPKPSAAAAVSG